MQRASRRGSYSIRGDSYSSITGVRRLSDRGQCRASFAVRARAGTTRRAGNLAVNRLPAPGVLSISKVA